MTRTPADDAHPVLPGCEAWSSPAGGPHGFLVLHGFTGNPLSVRPLAEALAAAGFVVEMPRLPGHGTHPDDLALTTWDDWRAEAEAGLARLRARCPDGRVVVGGLSVGGALACALASAHPDLAGVVAVNSPMAVPEGLDDLIRQLVEEGVDTIDGVAGDIADPEVGETHSYGRMPASALLSLLDAAEGLRAGLPAITVPVLVATSRQDHVISPGDGDVLAAAVSGPVERLWLERSYHVATLDFDRDELVAAAVAFAEKVVATA
ncbi:MAG: alpha/beta hydrolase [Acidimicrobiia bacterium]